MTATQKLEAIKAFINGEWDNPSLMEVGPLFPTLEQTIEVILDMPTGKTYFYLLGEDCSREYHDGGIDAVMAVINDYDFNLCTFNPDTDHPASFLMEAEGYFGYAEITEAEYMELLKIKEQQEEEAGK